MPIYLFILFAFTFFFQFNFKNSESEVVAVFVFKLLNVYRRSNFYFFHFIHGQYHHGIFMEFLFNIYLLYRVAIKQVHFLNHRHISITFSHKTQSNHVQHSAPCSRPTHLPSPPPHTPIPVFIVSNWPTQRTAFTQAEMHKQKRKCTMPVLWWFYCLG